MALFGSDDEEPETEEVDPPEAQPGEGETEGEHGSAPDEEASQAPDEEDARSEGSPEEGEGDLDVEEALKELSARMAMLSSNLEGVQESRTELEDKLGTVEQRMSRLGSLAEAVSSEYNPFVSENAPDEPSWNPELEAEPGLEGGGAPGPDPGPGEGPDAATGSPDGHPADEDDAAGETPAPEAAKATAEVDPAPEDHASGASTPPDAEASTEDHAEQTDGDTSTNGRGEVPEIPETSPEHLEPAEAEAIDDVDPEPARNPFRDQGTGSSRSMPRYDEDGELEENMLLLEWVGMMLDRVGRAGLMDLLDYYQNLGWLGPDTKEQATRVAIGVDAPDRVDENWRGDVELHRRSLVAIQRLQGNEVPAARVDELQLDLRRLFEE